ncbi:jg4493 [Pararge aegeria aegeria]|uniref:Jg4493 protein n=1 Tax=Pararge aegeria aegeria TaxID=348720 RepID=A0A8S4QLT0_9NEOP|nr:jg4493 [Pararge aegeria aegeria]
MNVGVPRCWNSDRAPVNPPMWWTSSSETQGAAGSKRYKTGVFGTPSKDPAVVRPLVDMMMMMYAKVNVS